MDKTPASIQEQLEAIASELSRIADAHAEASAERAELRGLMVQLRELARKQVRAQEDLARAVGAGDGARRAKECGDI